MRLSAGTLMENTKKVKTTAAVFELPQKLGILQAPPCRSYRL